MMVDELDRCTCIHAWKIIITVISMAAVLGGCSSDFSRLTEEMTEKEITFNKEVNRKTERLKTHDITHDVVVSNNLPPVPPPVPPSDITHLIKRKGNSDSELSQSERFYPLPQKKIFRTFVSSEDKNEKKANYIVQKGDTLSAISRNYNTTVVNLKAQNNLNDNTIHIGQILTVPCCNPPFKNQPSVISNSIYNNTTEHESIKNTVKSSLQTKETEYIKNTAEASLSNKFEKEEEKEYSPNLDPKTHLHLVEEKKPLLVQEQHQAEEQATKTKIEEWKKHQTDTDASSQNFFSDKQDNQAHHHTTQQKGISLYWPVSRGHILSNYEQHNGISANEGIDIEVPEGTPVKAAESGVVIYADEGLKEFGKTILIRHDNALVTVYGHNSVILVKRGQRIQCGEKIAYSGISGNIASPRLHFEVRQGSNPVNPLSYLK